MFRFLPDFSGDWRAKLRKEVAWRLHVILGLVLAFSLAGDLGKLFMLFELMSHFRAQYFWIGVVGLGVMVWLRNWKWTVIPAAIVILNGPGVLCWYFGKPAVVEGERIRFFLSNVHYSRVDHQRLIEMIEQERTDVVVLEEVQASLVTAMKPLEKKYPFKLIVSREDAFGIALYSRIPLEGLEDIYYGDSEVPSIAGTLKTKSGDVFLLATHPLPPGKPDYFAGRNEHLRLMAQDVAGRKGRIVIIGDLNVSPWSPYYKDFIKITGLSNARKGFGLQPSWPTQLPPLMIPIDHLLHSPGLTTIECRTGSRTGSDHLPLIVELSAPMK